MSLFLERTKQLLKERPKNITLALIAEETGLTKDWLDMLLYRKPKEDGRELDPGIKRLEILYNYLADKPFSFENQD